MASVAAVLLDEVADEPPQADVPAVWPVGVDELVQPAVRERGPQPCAGALDGAVPEPVEVFRRVVSRRWA